jgi:hypothetical protein
MSYPIDIQMRFPKCVLCVLCFFLLIGIPSSTEAQQSHPNLDGMWSDPPATTIGQFCAGWCTDAGLDYLNRLLDDPANDARPYRELEAEALKYQQEKYIVPRLSDAALKTYPLDPADDPSFLRCEPYGLARQMRSRHQLEIRQRGNDRIELRYGEWDARRTVYLDGRKAPANQAPTLLGHSVAHWDGQELVIESSGIKANRYQFNAEHSDQLRIVERYTCSQDGKTLWLAATLEDPWSLRQPIVIKRMWRWAPESRIDPYKDCQIPTEFKKGVKP